jgi:predicted nucleotidyltransferase
VSELFDRQRIHSVLQAIVEGLDGDWLLVGGALVSLWLEPRRTTEDLDLIAVSGSMEQRLALLSFTESLDLPVEAVNSAADFFVHSIEGWRSETEVLMKGKRGRILRPTPTLFLLLKMRRLSEQDLEDCVAVVSAVKNKELRLDAPRLTAALAALAGSQDAALNGRREKLLSLIQG